MDTFDQLIKLSAETYSLSEDEDLAIPHDLHEYETKYYELHALLSDAIAERKRTNTHSSTLIANGEGPLERLATSQAQLVASQTQFLEQVRESHTHTDLRIEKIKIPTFRGNYEDWPQFSVPEPSLLDTQMNRLVRWNQLQAMVQGFWKRWHTEYLTSLQSRGKWQEGTTNLEVGTLVVLKEPNLPPAKWVLGRIQEVHPGQDSKVRVVTVGTAHGIDKRPITKIAVLPLN
ncbi:hypothetical protein KR084_005236 [Drosophila pseudotakahashii]|nr:hypothetical protein KR084_005236 [Drosophila pseudotakahashii]